MRLIYGVGYNDGKYPTKNKGSKKHLIEYKIWFAMIARCYSSAVHKNSKSYVDCTVSENFKSYSYFYEWCQDQIGFGCHGFDLDKDLLCNDGVYSEENCLFLPSEINKSIDRKYIGRSLLSIGTRFNKLTGCYDVQLRKNNDRVYFYGFKTMIDASEKYRIEKKIYMNELAEKWANSIDKRAYAKLKNWQESLEERPK